MRSIAVCLGLLALGACGQSLEEEVRGVYATFEVAAEATDDEREFFGDEVIAKLDDFDRKLAVAEDEEALHARLDLNGGARFDYVGPLASGDRGDARMSGTWSADEKSVVLTVERATGSDVAEPPRSVRLARLRAGLLFPGLRDPKSGADVVLPKRR